MIFSDDWSEQETDLKPVQSQKTIWRVPQVKDKQEEKISKKREIIWIEKKDHHLNQDKGIITWDLNQNKRESPDQDKRIITWIKIEG